MCSCTRVRLWFILNIIKLPFETFGSQNLHGHLFFLERHSCLHCFVILQPFTSAKLRLQVDWLIDCFKATGILRNQDTLNKDADVQKMQCANFYILELQGWVVVFNVDCPLASAPYLSTMLMMPAFILSGWCPAMPAGYEFADEWIHPQHPG